MTLLGVKRIEPAPTLPPLRGGPLPPPQAREGWGGGFGRRRSWHNLDPAVRSAQAAGRTPRKEAHLTDRPATRLYVSEGLATGAAVELDLAQAHRLRHVLRLGPE